MVWVYYTFVLDNSLQGSRVQVEGVLYEKAAHMKRTKYLKHCGCVLFASSSLVVIVVLDRLCIYVFFNITKLKKFYLSGIFENFQYFKPFYKVAKIKQVTCVWYHIMSFGAYLESEDKLNFEFI